MTAHFHGGYPGLKVGDVIESPDVHGSSWRLSAHLPDEAPHGNRTDVVYVTTVQDEARAFAALYPDGALYRVEPESIIGPDPDSPDTASMCQRARIVEVVSERIVFAHRPYRGWISMMQRSA